MAKLEIEVFIVRKDNFAALLHDPASGRTASIDALDEQPILDVLTRRGWTLTEIFTTHHHHDHVEANLALKQRFGLTITGPVDEADKIPGIDIRVGDGDRFDFAGHKVEVIGTPGHTAGHICYSLPDDKLLFSADTLFALGCGRLFERSAKDMWNSLSKLLELPDDTQVYFGHEYTLSNGKFAVTVDPENAALRDRVKQIEATLAAGGHTAPTSLGIERRTNPFLRPDDPAIRQHLGMEKAEDWEVFGEIRARKDKF